MYSRGNTKVDKYLTKQISISVSFFAMQTISFLAFVNTLKCRHFSWFYFDLYTIDCLKTTENNS